MVTMDVNYLFTYYNEVIMSTTFSQIYNGKFGYISLQYEYIRQLMYDGIITIVYIRFTNWPLYTITLSQALVNKKKNIKNEIKAF